MSKKKAKKSPSKSDIASVDIPEKELTGIRIDPNGKRSKVVLSFIEKTSAVLHEVSEEEEETLTVEEAAGGDNELMAEVDAEENQGSVYPEYRIGSPHMPKKEFLSAMKKLRKHALALVGMEKDAKDTAEYRVSAISITGNHNLKQSRVTLTMSKMCEMTGKELKIGPGPQISLYGDKAKYDDVAALAREIDAIIDYAWEYLNGDYAEADGTQLALFERKGQLVLKK